VVGPAARLNYKGPVERANGPRGRPLARAPQRPLFRPLKWGPGPAPKRGIFCGVFGAAGER